MILVGLPPARKTVGRSGRAPYVRQRPRALATDDRAAIRSLAATKSLRALAADLSVSRETVRVVLLDAEAAMAETPGAAGSVSGGIATVGRARRGAGPSLTRTHRSPRRRGCSGSGPRAGAPWALAAASSRRPCRDPSHLGDGLVERQGTTGPRLVRRPPNLRKVGGRVVPPAPGERMAGIDGSPHIPMPILPSVP
jgi:hypothetical protein